MDHDDLLVIRVPSTVLNPTLDRRPRASDDAKSATGSRPERQLCANTGRSRRHDERGQLDRDFAKNSMMCSEALNFEAHRRDAAGIRQPMRASVALTPERSVNC
jgi:hypothetical protein